VPSPSSGSSYLGPPHISRHNTVSLKLGANVSLLILVVDDEPDVEMRFRQQFRRDLRTGRFVMEFVWR